MRPIVFLSLLAVLASGPALAQTERLPRTSPAERTYRDVDQSIQRQQRELRSEQQQQFEINQLRQDIQRQNIAPPRAAGPGCPGGAIGC